jgi:hypothetical protein
VKSGKILGNGKKTKRRLTRRRVGERKVVP